MSAKTIELPPSSISPPSAKMFSVEEDWDEIFTEPARASFSMALQAWLPTRRWFRSKARTIESVSVREQIAVPLANQKAFLVLLEVNYTENEPEVYVVPLMAAFGQKANSIKREWPQLILAHVSLNRQEKNGLIYDAIVNKEFCRALLVLTSQQRKFPGSFGELEAEPTSILRTIRRQHGLGIEPSVSKAEQSNSSVIYKGRLILKFFRRLEPGINPELEIARFLSARHFAHSPPLAGALEYHQNRGKTYTMAVVTSFIPGSHDAWVDTLVALRQYYERVQSLPVALRHGPPQSGPWGLIAGYGKLPRTPADLVGPYLEDAVTLGQRTGALHQALASDSTEPAFRPQPWTKSAQESLFRSLRDLTRHIFQLLEERLSTLDAESQILADKILPLEHLIIQRFLRITQQPIEAVRIRTHGDYHLGQVLHHEEDYLIIDFEGEPAISLEERRAKQSALRDVAGMVYSFFYAANAVRLEPAANPLAQLPHKKGVAWARYWSVWVGTTFVRAYLDSTRSAPFIPADETALKVMLDVELLRKAIYELGYELNNRPDWVKIAFQVLLDLLDPENPI